jgi:hypothetical protein
MLSDYIDGSIWRGLLTVALRPVDTKLAGPVGPIY